MQKISLDGQKEEKNHNKYSTKNKHVRYLLLFAITKKDEW